MRKEAENKINYKCEQSGKVSKKVLLSRSSMVLFPQTVSPIELNMTIIFFPF